MLLSGLLACFTACESDLDKVVYDESVTQPAVLQNINDSYVLDVNKSDETAIAFQWDAPSINVKAPVTSSLEMDVQGKDFANAAVLTSVKAGNSYSVTNADLNSALLKMIEKYGMEMGPINLEFRIGSILSNAIKPFYSNVITSTVTPFVGEKEYPQVWIVGDYCGWNHANSQLLYSAAEDDNYEAMIYFGEKAANGWKLCEKADWSVNWGENTAIEAEAKSSVLKLEGGNISAFSHKSYLVKFNTTTLTLEMSQGCDSWGVVGDFNSWGATPDEVMTLASETKYGKLQYYLTATVKLKANDGWKIRPDGKWSNDRGPSAFKKIDGAKDKGDGNFTVTEDGTYTIKWFFNKVDASLEVVKN